VKMYLRVLCQPAIVLRLVRVQMSKITCKALPG